MSDIDMKDDKVLMEKLASAIEMAPDGIVKEAADAGSKFTRRKLREDSFSTAIIPHDPISKSDLNQFVDREDPGIICEMEPDSFGAKTMSFNDTADNVSYKANKYVLVFHVNSTPEFIKNVNYLMTYRMDLREVIVDNSLRDLSRQKDFYFMNLVNSIVGLVPGAVSAETGLEQNIVYGGRLTRDNFVSATNILQTRDLANGIFLTNKQTWSDIRRWGRDVMGGSFSEELNRKGDAAFPVAEWQGVKFIVTWKHDLVPNGVFYEFTAPNYLGRAGILKEPTMYVEKKKDILRFSCREIVGVTIANVAGVQKVTFAGISGNYGGDGRLVLDTNTGKYKKATDSSAIEVED